MAANYLNMEQQYCRKAAITVLPKQFAVPGAIFLGDALGALDVKSLSGIDRAMECGYIASEVLHDALLKARL